jgi:acyl dehydratase
MMVHVGDIFENEFTVSNEIINGFIALFKDKNPLHTVEAFAKSKGFEKKVVHGNILNGYISYFIGECLPNKNVIIHNQNINYKNAFYLDDILHLKVEIISIHESVQAIECSFEFKNQTSKVIAKGTFQIGII